MWNKLLHLGKTIDVSYYVENGDVVIFPKKNVINLVTNEKYTNIWSTKASIQGGGALENVFFSSTSMKRVKRIEIVLKRFIFGVTSEVLLHLVTPHLIENSSFPAKYWIDFRC